MEKVSQEIKFIYGEPFVGFYQLKLPQEYHFSHPTFMKDVQEINEEYRELVEYVPVAVWNGASVTIEDVEYLLTLKTKFVTNLRNDLAVFHEKNWVDLSEFVMGNYYLGTKNINIETYKMNNGLNVDDVDDDIRLAINKIEHLKKSNPIVREYIAMSAYLVQLEREIAELKLIAESLKSAPKKDSSNLCLFQEVVKKHRK